MSKCLQMYLSNEITQSIKVDKAARKENGGAESDSQSSVGDPPSAPPPPLPRSQEFPRKQLEQFQLHSFPKVRFLLALTILTLLSLLEWPSRDHRWPIIA